MDFTEQDEKFLTGLGFIIDKSNGDLEEEESEEWITYGLEINDHPFIKDLWITIGLEPDTIQVFCQHDNPFIEKPFSHENLLAIMNFLHLPIPSEVKPLTIH